MARWLSSFRCMRRVHLSFFGAQFVPPKIRHGQSAILVCGLAERQSSSASVANAAAQTLRLLVLIFILRGGPERTMIYS